MRAAALLTAVVVMMGGCTNAPEREVVAEPTPEREEKPASEAPRERSPAPTQEARLHGSLPARHRWPLGITADGCNDIGAGTGSTGTGSCAASMTMRAVMYALSGAPVLRRTVSPTVVARGSLYGEPTVVRAIVGVRPEVLVAVRSREGGAAYDTEARWSRWRMAFPMALGNKNPPAKLLRAFREAACVVAPRDRRSSSC